MPSLPTSIAPVRGAGYVLEALPLLLEPRIRWFVLGPLLINSALFAAAVWFGASAFGEAIQRFLPDWLQWLDWLLWLLFALVGMAVLFFGFALVANLLAAPFSGRLAAAVEAMLTGKASPATGGEDSALPGLWQDVKSELGKLGFFAARALPLLALFLLPGLNLIAPVLWLLFGAWALGLEYLDFPLANHGLRFRQQRGLLAGRLGILLGFGGTMMLVTLLPVVNFIAVPLGVVAATLLCQRELPPFRDGPGGTRG